MVKVITSGITIIMKNTMERQYKVLKDIKQQQEHSQFQLKIKMLKRKKDWIDKKIYDLLIYHNEGHLIEYF